MKDQKHFDINEVKERIHIWDVLRHFGHDCPEQCKAIRSPLRDERSPSFSIFADGKMAKDHATGESYDVILLYEALSGCNRHEAIVGCGAIAGLTAGEIPPEFSVPPPPRSRVTTKKKADRGDFRSKLGPYTQEVRQQMIAAGREFIEADDGNILRQFCKMKRISTMFMREMIESGMVGVLQHPALRSPAIAWMFHNQHFGHGCKLRFEAGSSHKTLWWEGKSRNHFFGEQLFQINEPVILTEGESDAIILLQHGINAIGVTGAQVIPDPRVTHFFTSHRKVGIWYDADEAGRDATVKIQEAIESEASGAIVCNNIGNKVPDGMDIGECWVKYGNRFMSYAINEFDRLKKLQ